MVDFDQGLVTLFAVARHWSLLSLGLLMLGPTQKTGAQLVDVMARM
jgi:hypothetical protein